MGDARAGQDAPPCHPRRQARGPLRIENQSIPLDPMQAPPEPAPAIQQPTFPEGACRLQMSVTLASTQTRRPARENGTNVSGRVISRVTLFPICTPGRPSLRPEAERLGSGRQAAQGKSLGPVLVPQAGASEIDKITPNTYCYASPVPRPYLESRSQQLCCWCQSPVATKGRRQATAPGSPGTRM